MSFNLDPYTWIIWIFSYLLGGIPVSYIFGKAIHGIDLREHGSGNLGATNVFRILGKRWGFLVFILDVAKGIFPLFIALGKWGDTYHLSVIFTGMFAILGHIFTPYLAFRGGKGVATALGVFMVLTPFPMIIALILFLIVVILSGFVSIGSMIAAISGPITFFAFYGFYGRENLFFALVFLSVLIVFTHRSNIRKIFNGKERKIYYYWN